MDAIEGQTAVIITVLSLWPLRDTFEKMTLAVAAVTAVTVTVTFFY